MREKSLRVADPGNGVQTLAVKIGNLSRGIRIKQVVKNFTI
jgi:hypothetical protein